MDTNFIAHFALGAGVGLPVGLVLREAIVALVEWLRERRSTARLQSIGAEQELRNALDAELARLRSENWNLRAELSDLRGELSLAGIHLRDVPSVTAAPEQAQ